MTSTPPENDAESLARLIELPIAPAKVVWETREFGKGAGFGPEDWGIIAVLEFSPAVFEQVTELAPASESSTRAELPTLFAPKWLQDACDLEVDESSPKSYLVKGVRRDPRAFAKSPLLQGFCVVCEGHSKLVLFLHTQ